MSVRPDLDPGGSSGPCLLDGIREEIHHREPEHGRVSLDLWKRSDGPDDLASSGPGAHLPSSVVDHVREGDVLPGQRGAAHPREGQAIIDPPAPAAGTGR